MNPASYLCSSHARTWISRTYICHCFFYVQWFEVRSDCLFCWDWWNHWSSLFIHVIELLYYNWRFANFWLEIWSPWPNLPVKVSNRSITGYLLNTFTIRISLCFSSAREFQMGNFQKYWSQNVGHDFIVLDFFHGRNILKVDGRDPQIREKNAPAGRFTCMTVKTFFS